MKLPDVKWPDPVTRRHAGNDRFVEDTRSMVTVRRWAQGHHQHNSQLPAPRSQALKSKGWHLRVTQREEEMISVGHGMVLRHT